MKNKAKTPIILSKVDSTNNYANHLILSEAAEEGTVVLAHYQEKGRGQVGNQWESEAGKNLLCSVILYPKFLLAEHQFFISKAVSLALYDFLKNEIGNVTIKWPNDLYAGKEKIAGILIENAIKGKFLLQSVAGIGLNLNQEKFLSDAPNPVSLKQLTSKKYNVEEVAGIFSERLFFWYNKLKKGNLEEIAAVYFSHLFRVGKWSRYRGKDIEFEGRIVGVGEYGQLMLENRQGKITNYMFKEVEFVL
ncbi:MAG TPA: biotin--[acetyl-CoA-carboxylase] ligase [Draconibacterium sp.]|nr:biotin--[acetyl-CoA-carboxylase] ligase [Draconibacterium sp.]